MSKLFILVFFVLGPLDEQETETLVTQGAGLDICHPAEEAEGPLAHPGLSALSPSLCSLWFPECLLNLQ